MKRWFNTKTIGCTFLAGVLLFTGGCGLLTTRSVATFAGKEVGKKVYEKYKEDRQERKQAEMTEGDGFDDEGMNDGR